MKVSTIINLEIDGKTITLNRIEALELFNQLKTALGIEDGVDNSCAII